jgi:hypothetical protein
MCSDVEAGNFTTLVYSAFTQSSQMCVENDGDIAEKWSHNLKRCMNHSCQFYRCWNYTFCDETWKVYFRIALRIVMRVDWTDRKNKKNLSKN